MAEQEARMSLLRGMAENRMTDEQKEELEKLTPKFVKSSEETANTRCLNSKYVPFMESLNFINFGRLNFIFSVSFLIKQTIWTA